MTQGDRIGRTQVQCPVGRTGGRVAVGGRRIDCLEAAVGLPLQRSVDVMRLGPVMLRTRHRQVRHRQRFDLGSRHRNGHRRWGVLAGTRLVAGCPVNGRQGHRHAAEDAPLLERRDLGIAGTIPAAARPARGGGARLWPGPPGGGVAAFGSTWPATWAVCPRKVLASFGLFTDARGRWQFLSPPPCHRGDDAVRRRNPSAATARRLPRPKQSTA